MLSYNCKHIGDKLLDLAAMSVYFLPPNFFVFNNYRYRNESPFAYVFSCTLSIWLQIDARKLYWLKNLSSALKNKKVVSWWKEISLLHWSRSLCLNTHWQSSIPFGEIILHLLYCGYALKNSSLIQKLAVICSISWRNLASDGLSCSMG